MKRTRIPAAAVFVRPSMTSPLSLPALRFLEGDGTGPDGPQGAAPGGVDNSGSEAGAEGSDPSAEAGSEGVDKDSGSKADDPRLKAARDEAAQNRIKARDAQQAADAAEQQRADLIQTLGRALGLVKDDDKGGDGPDADALAKQVEQSQAQAAEAARELAVYKAAAAHGADPAKLLDSRSFLASIAEVDHTDSKALGTAIKTAVQGNSSFALARAAGASTADTASGPGGGSAPKPEVSLADALAQHYSN